MSHLRSVVLRPLAALFVVSTCTLGQIEQKIEPGNIVRIHPGANLAEIVRDAAHVVPSKRQWEWQRREFIGFLHFGMNTFVHREWGDGKASPENFRPTALDADQWARVAKAAGMKTLILTTKHHDGFCLWPSKFTTYSVQSSPWKNGRGDVVGEVAAACRKEGLKFGVYLSPWDRHDPSYGDSPRYNEHFRNQLRELLTKYGEIAEVWFDGACGEGPNGKRQIYDWQSYYHLIRQLQPNAVIAIMGPDVRWVGTESGYGRETEWSVLPADQFDVDSVAAHSQQNALDAAFVPHDLTQEDLGSRERLANAKALMWYPAETDVSIRPGWFYHASEDGRVKSPEKLVDIYYSSVGRNSVLLLNVPPDTSGRISPIDSANLCGMRTILDQTFSENLLHGASVVASSERSGHPCASVLTPGEGRYWTTGKGVDTAQILFDLHRTATVDRAMLKEAIRIGQRIEHFSIEGRNDGPWFPVAEGTTVGYERLLRFAPVTASSFRLVIDRSRECPALASVGLFRSPPVVAVTPSGGVFADSVVVRLASGRRNVDIRYTTDGTVPTLRSSLYTRPLVLHASTTVRALAVLRGRPCADITTAGFVRGIAVDTVILDRQPDPKYSSMGAAGLLNPMIGDPEDLSARWLGYEGTDFGATFDLGGVHAVHSATIHFLQNQDSWVFLPTSVVIETSSDGTRWSAIDTLTNPLVEDASVRVKEFRAEGNATMARYVRIVARSVGVCPPWHKGAGKAAWLFTDAVVIR